jgi:hypothetical protein
MGKISGSDREEMRGAGADLSAAPKILTNSVSEELIIYRATMGACSCKLRAISRVSCQLDCRLGKTSQDLISLSLKWFIGQKSHFVKIPG